MSRLQTGAVQPVLADVPLDEVVRAALVGLPAEGRVHVAGPLPVASADAGLLERVLANLLGNALRHTDGAVELAGSTDRPPGAAGVADHGRGVPARPAAPDVRAVPAARRQRRGAASGSAWPSPAAWPRPRAAAWSPRRRPAAG